MGCRKVYVSAALNTLYSITDFTSVLTLKGSYQAGYAVIAATAVSTVALVLL